MAEVLKYPDNVAKFNKWLRFDVRAGRHVGRGQIIAEKGQSDSVVMAAALYLPTSALKSSMTVGYDTTEFSGLMMEMAAQSATDIASAKAGTDAWSSIGDAAKSAWNSGKEIWKGSSAETAGEFAKSVAMKAASVFVGNQLEALTGQKANPRTDIIFTNQDYRTWQFEYILIPRTLKEAQNIEKIVNMFRFYMLPIYRGTNAGQGPQGSYMMGYPYEWTISIYGQDQNDTASFGRVDTVVDTAGQPIVPGSRALHHANKIGRSVLRNLAVDQAGGGKVAFVTEKGSRELFPLVTSMTLDFQEVILLGRDQAELVGGTPDGGDPRNGEKPGK